jgi:hypothetical protein
MYGPTGLRTLLLYFRAMVDLRVVFLNYIFWLIHVILSRDLLI